MDGLRKNICLLVLAPGVGGLMVAFIIYFDLFGYIVALGQGNYMQTLLAGNSRTIELSIQGSVII